MFKVIFNGQNMKMNSFIFTFNFLSHQQSVAIEAENLMCQLKVEKVKLTGDQSTG